MHTTAPLFLETESYTSTLHLINALKLGVQANVLLYERNGTLLATKRLDLSANSQKTIGIKSILVAAGSSAQVGSVEVFTPGNSSAVLGQVSIARVDDSAASVDEELFMPDPSGSQTLRAVIDTPERSPLVAVANTSSSVSQAVRLECIPSLGQPVTKTLSLGPKQMELVRACNESGNAAASIEDVETQVQPRQVPETAQRNMRTAGLAITSDGPAGSIAAFGFVAHDDHLGRYLSSMAFFDPKLLRSPNFVFSGVPVGDSSFFPGATYVPEAAVANFSSEAQTIEILQATTSAAKSNLQEVSSVSIPAGSSKLIRLDGLSGNRDWQNSFLIRSKAQPGDIIAKMDFKSSGPVPNLELLAKDEQHWQTFGDHPWSVENGTRSTLLLFNHSALVKEATIRIGSGDQIWLKIIRLQPNETRAISVNRLIQGGTLDDKKHTIDKRTTSGEIAWFVPSPGSPEVSGRLVQIDAAGHSAHSFSCYIGSGVCALSLPSQTFFLDQEAGDDFETVTAEYCTYVAPPTGCPNDNQYTPNAATTNWNWSSGNTAIATIPTGATSQTAGWYGVAVGSTTSLVKAQVQQNPRNSCTVGGGVNVNPTVMISGPSDVVASAGSAPSVPIMLTASVRPANGTYSWTTSNANVKLSGQTTATVTLTGVSGGSSVVYVKYTVGGMSTTVSQNVLVHQPTSLTASSAYVNTQCTALNYTTITSEITYTILDQNGKPILQAMPAFEAFAPVSNTCKGVPNTPTATSTRSSSQGIFGPDLLQLCSSSCLPASKSGQSTGNCDLLVKQTWNANGFNVQTKTIDYGCAGASIN